MNEKNQTLVIWENVLIIVLVSSSRNLQSPMYLFLQQLSLSDLLASTNIIPTLLQTVKNEGTTISFLGCITQLYFLGGSKACECLLLAVMSYDRYVAICIPLHYSSVTLFSLFLLIYIMTVWENALIIVLVSSSRNLQSPMYFFLQQLSLCDLLGSLNIVPTLLQTVIN
ncbi:hypothetical protein XELAEV_18019660mg [Xenopus laevis]|uniref:G-protein coupled receptors family 1 profile domain-containing protein n=1 Tax=Xenopus laevis TaxID=8355 RepID=A0A974HUS9_XENLA|nr:hypothetical protein XELAEV_18019660mg [Xenopus laevis]